jgi:hypothetical protein
MSRRAERGGAGWARHVTAPGLGLVGLVALAGPGPARADEVHLVSGGVIHVEAWRDVGDAIEFARSGGIVRITKAEIARIVGTSTRTDLRMYSAPATAGRAPEEAKVAAREMADLLRQGEGLFAQTVLPAEQKIEALRRLGQKWQALTVPEGLKDTHGRGQKAIQSAVEAYTAEAQGSSPTARQRVDQAKTELLEALGETRKAAGEPG